MPGETTMRLTTVNIKAIAVMTAIITMVLLTACDQATPQIVGGDKDAHGCLPSAGYTWCDATQKCIRPWEENCTAQPATPPATTPAGSSDNQLVGNDRDEHGCIGSAGYSWCEAKRMCLRPWEENCPDDGSPQ